MRAFRANASCAAASTPVTTTNAPTSLGTTAPAAEPTNTSLFALFALVPIALGAAALVWLAVKKCKRQDTSRVQEDTEITKDDFQ